MVTVPKRRVWAIVVASIGIVCVIAVGVWMRANGGAPTAMDLVWHDLTLLDPDSPFATLARVLAFAGSAIGVLACWVIILGPLALQRRYRDMGTVTTALILGLLLSQLLKMFVERPRPGDALLELSDFSYPSGHSMGAAALSVVLVLVLSGGKYGRTLLIVFWSVAGVWMLAMVWSRAALGVHWLTDTIAGALLGASAALLAWAIWGNLKMGRAPQLIDTSTAR